MWSFWALRVAECTCVDTVQVMSQTAQDVLRMRSPARLAMFRWYVRRYLRRHFHGVRLLRPPPRIPDGPVLVVLNHPSWWDPLIALRLSEELAGKRHFAPIDAEQLERYGFFRRLGFYGLDRTSRAGVKAFLQTTRELLSLDDGAVWITAQGRFTDPRQRPADLEAGVGHVARSMDRGVVLPLALEYPFWDERHPEALAAFGDPIDASVLTGRAGECLATIEDRLMEIQDQLGRAARARDPEPFSTLVGGEVGVGGVYDLWRRVLAALRGERFDVEHRGRLPDSGQG